MTNNNQMAFNLSVNDVYSVDWVHSAKYTKDWTPKTKKILPPPDFIREIMRYDSESGFLYWRHRKDMRKEWNNRWANKKIKPSSPLSDTIGIMYNGHRFYIIYHRIIWCHYYGEWPNSNLVIDHINRNHYDNSITNLRLVTYAENNKNRKVPRDNNSGHQGVCWKKRYKRWEASIGVDKKNIYLGVFKNKEDAIKARKDAEIKYGFHENHGRIMDEDA